MNPIAGGANNIKKVGSSLSGIGLKNIILLTTIVNNTTHQIKPMLKKNQDTSFDMNCTPAIGISMFPTIGMNHEGLMCFISNFECLIQRLIIYSVKND